ncbi:Rv1733c family protein [Streptomyces griseoluteus]|uniref:Rv1733c family protein n=1 Tax=Streptomyces griseoluteus TaxID=29306 RepID=UPI0036A84218
MRTKHRLWRWRSNPLKRREDVVEAWIVLLAWVVAVVGGATAGALTAQATAGLLAEQRAHRHAVHAVLLTDARPSATGPWSGRVLVETPVRWRSPDGAARTDRALVNSGLRAGARVVVWQDDWGKLVSAKPANSTESGLEAGFFGLGAALAAGAAGYGAGALGRLWLDRRRMARWDREWGVVEPRWARRPG